MASMKVVGLSSAAVAAAITSFSIAASSSAAPAASLPIPENRRKNSLQAARPLGISSRSTFLRSLAPSAMAFDTAFNQDSQTDQVKARDSPPEVMTEFMVDMKCEGCVSAVRKKLECLSGVKKVDIDLANQVVKVQGTTDLKSLNEALLQTGRKARLIGQGSPSDYRVTATVAEFKGPLVFGVARIVQVSMELVRIEASFSGLSEGSHAWTINQYGDLTRGAASTGEIYNPSRCTPPVGDLGLLVANAKGEAEHIGSKSMLNVADLPGRACVIYANEDKTQPGIAASVIARSAGVGENYKKLCSCDGTVIWDSTNSDFVKVEK